MAMNRYNCGQPDRVDISKLTFERRVDWPGPTYLHQHETEAEAFECIQRSRRAVDYGRMSEGDAGPEPGERPIPQTTRDVCVRRARGRCEGCGERRPLELHHQTYDYVGCELPDDLLALCRGCHHAEHRDTNGDFWRDPEEMGAHWAPYYEALWKDD